MKAWKDAKAHLDANPAFPDRHLRALVKEIEATTLGALLDGHEDKQVASLERTISLQTSMIAAYDKDITGYREEIRNLTGQLHEADRRANAAGNAREELRKTARETIEQKNAEIAALRKDHDEMYEQRSKALAEAKHYQEQNLALHRRGDELLTERNGLVKALADLGNKK